MYFLGVIVKSLFVVLVQELVKVDKNFVNLFENLLGRILG